MCQMGAGAQGHVWVADVLPSCHCIVKMALSSSLSVCLYVPHAQAGVRSK